MADAAVQDTVLALVERREHRLRLVDGQGHVVVGAWLTEVASRSRDSATAIREAAADGNRRTVADPNWLPLVNTPPYPDQPSGLSALSGASVRTLQEFFGTDDVAFGATNAVGITRDYTTFSQAVDEVVNARVWSGIHFRNADEVGAAIGQRIARWQEHRFPQARDDNDDHNHHGHHHDR